MSRLKLWLRNYRFLVALVALLIVSALLFVCLSHSPGSSWQETWRALSSNLAAESLGAVTSVVVIGWFLKRQEEQKLQAARASVFKNIHRLSFNTVYRLATVIPATTGQDEAADIIHSTYIRRVFTKDDLSSLIEQLSNHFKGFVYLEHPETLGQIQTLASDMRSNWTDFLDMFEQYLGPEEFLGIANIIECLDLLASESKLMGGLLEVLMMGQGADTAADELADTPLASSMADLLTELVKSVVSLLRILSLR